ncbi:MAG: hypothetical protein LAQ30_23915 [Acidobacteriia bacterium]|nr:hypothetical protein [Terriglobia bacterium]
MTRGWPNFNEGAFLTVFGDGRLHHALDAVAAQPAVVADAFDFQQAPTDVPANLLQVGQVRQSLVHVEVVGVAEDPFRPAAASFLEVLFQIEILVLNVQAGVHPFLDDPRAKLAGELLGHHAVKNQLHPVGPSQVQVVANDLLEESRPRSGRSKICARLTSICQMDSAQS